MIQSKQKKKKMKKSEESLCELWEMTKWNYLHTTVVSEEKRGKMEKKA